MKQVGRYFWGVLLILVGVIFLGNNVNWWDISIFFDGWWTLFIIIPSIYGLFKKDSFVGSILSLVIGVLLLLASQDVIGWNRIWKLFIPILIIVIGLSFLFGNVWRRRRRVSKDAREYIAVFSGVEEKLMEVSHDFYAVAVFGSVELDLRKADIKQDLVIDVVSVFGGVELKVPKSVRVEANGVPIFGGLENKCDEEEAKSTIYLNYTCVFGGITIL